MKWCLGEIGNLLPFTIICHAGMASRAVYDGRCCSINMGNSIDCSPLSFSIRLRLSLSLPSRRAVFQYSKLGKPKCSKLGRTTYPDRGLSVPWIPACMHREGQRLLGNALSRRDSDGSGSVSEAWNGVGGG
ncbi:hypothetical protein IE53DRAFT_266343 [Violaceomyces palustris]|uniref:Uncharacterized protein n=1 Tax=Violaceomyces palustris TaxID=1673888 RepID=A0ACD0NMV4_9BASI|nr:hypothetical protein IE53DRAFT_266343 [Violaceomyces palustris]